jgi:hypothetical protein
MAGSSIADAIAHNTTPNVKTIERKWIKVHLAQVADSQVVQQMAAKPLSPASSFTPNTANGQRAATQRSVVT